MTVLAHVIAFLIIGFLLNIVGLPLLMVFLSVLGVDLHAAEGKQSLVSILFVLNVFYTGCWVYLIGVNKNV